MDIAQFPAIRNGALLLATLSFLVVLISVCLRLNGSHQNCTGQADCVRDLVIGGLHLPISVIRALHRLTASVSLVVAIFVTWSCLRPRPIQPAARYSLLLLVLMLFLAVIGILRVEPEAVWTRFANILGGLGLLSLSGQLVLATRCPVAETPGQAPSWILRAGLATLAATLVLGALIGSRVAAAACPSLPDCAGLWWPVAESWANLNPLVLLSSSPLAGDTANALHLLHRYCAVAALMLLGFFGVRGLRQPGTRSASISLLSLLALAAILGGLTVRSGVNLWLAIGHALLAGLLLVATHWLSLAERRVASADYYRPTIHAAP